MLRQKHQVSEQPGALAGQHSEPRLPFFPESLLFSSRGSLPMQSEVNLSTAGSPLSCPTLVYVYLSVCSGVCVCVCVCVCPQGKVFILTAKY